MKEQKICPFCGSEKGYYITERVIRDLFLLQKHNKNLIIR